MNFDEVIYLTDTGRRWDGWKVSVRDKMPQQVEWVKKGWVYRSTQEIIGAANAGVLPPKMMITVHPQRWTNKPGFVGERAGLAGGEECGEEGVGEEGRKRK